MIPDLLWRCPICSTNEALVHRSAFLRPERVVCTACWASWRVQRVPGDNFYLKLEKGGADPGGADPGGAGPGQELSITQWYDRMKAGIRLDPIQDPEFIPQADETLYLASKRAALQQVPFSALAGKASQPASETNPEAALFASGDGRLFLTDHRLAWIQGGQVRSFPLTRLASALAAMNYGLSIMADQNVYMVTFYEESLLKWVTYLSLVADQVARQNGRRIQVSHY